MTDLTYLMAMSALPVSGLIVAAVVVWIYRRDFWPAQKHR